MRISMYLGPSKPWWAYLGLKSNAALRTLLEARGGRAVLFDDPARIDHDEALADRRNSTFFYCLWDGIVDPPALQRASTLTAGSKGLILLTVGDHLRIPSSDFEVHDLYAEGQLTFPSSELPLDGRTQRVLLLSRLRNLLMPVKNVRNSGLRSGFDLLAGRPKVVFCGSYGVGREFLRQLCERHEVDLSHFGDFPFYLGSIDGGSAVYSAYLKEAGTCLGRLFQAEVIDSKFLFSAAHMLAREYSLNRIFALQLPFFFNGSAQGISINVYTTPFYRQHFFPDFGSSVGTGNYPRAADLVYFGKKTSKLDMVGDVEQLALAATEGSLEQHLNQRWMLYEAALIRDVRALQRG